MRALKIALPLLLVSGCATTGPSQSHLQFQAREAARLEVALSGFTPGKAVSCLPNRDIRGPEAYGDNVLLFRAGRNLVYRNDTQGSCSGVSHGEAIIIRQFQSRLCRGDIARTADMLTGMESSTCVFGDFVPYRR